MTAIVAQDCLIDWLGAAPSVRGLPDEYVLVASRSDAWVAFRTERAKAALPKSRAAHGMGGSARLVDRSATALLRLRYLEGYLGGVPAYSQSKRVQIEAPAAGD